MRIFQQKAKFEWSNVDFVGHGGPLQNPVLIAVRWFGGRRGGAHRPHLGRGCHLRVRDRFLLMTLPKGSLRIKSNRESIFYQEKLGFSKGLFTKEVHESAILGHCAWPSSFVNR